MLQDVCIPKLIELHGCLVTVIRLVILGVYRLYIYSYAVSRVPAVENHKTGGRVRFKGGYRV